MLHIGTAVRHVRVRHGGSMCENMTLEEIILI